MNTAVENFFAVFIPLFVAIDPLGLVPVFVGVTHRLSSTQRMQVSFQAVITALLISLGFMFLGQGMFHFLAITSADFKIAGGIVLLVLAVLDILITGKPAVNEEEMVGVVPLGMPLIAGPATLTTILVLAGKYGYLMTAVGLATNFGLLLVVLLTSEQINRLLGRNTLTALSKLVMVLLAAIAVNFIRQGILEAISNYHTR